jgi:hypothetical protein
MMIGMNVPQPNICEVPLESLDACVNGSAKAHADGGGNRKNQK